MSLFKLSLKIFAFLIVFLTLFMLAITINGKVNYYGELNDIKKQINELPNVELIKAYGNEVFFLEDIFVEIKVKNKGVMKFRQVGTNFPGYLEQIGNWEIRTYTCWPPDKENNAEPHVSYGMSMDITSKNFESLHFPKISNIPDAVKNYDNILKGIEKLPNASAASYLKVQDGKNIDYYAKCSANDSSCGMDMKCD